mgnify:CR=1 FL=1
MTVTATITSKRQLTIPIEMYKKLNLSQGDKVVVEDTNEGLVIRKAKAVIDRLSGSVEIPDQLKNIDLDQAIAQAKRLKFSKKSSN